jgi:thiol-disulfide isomerase/thioredoxin
MFKYYRAWLVAALAATTLAHAKTIYISSEEQYNQALKDNKQLVVKFSADWCSVCNGIRSPYEQIADEKEFSEVAFAQVDVDKLDGISKQNGIVGVPTFVYVENGAKKVEEIGVQNMPAFKDHLRDNLRKTFKLVQNDIDMSMSGEQATTTDTGSATSDMQAPATPEQGNENMFMSILLSIKNFIMLVLLKIQEFFMMIIDAIKGFFNK